MKHLPRKRIYRIYNLIDNSPVNSDTSNPAMLQNGIDTYNMFIGHPIASADKEIVEDGLIYNEFRLENSAEIPPAGIWHDNYYNSELYRLQNPEFSADYPTVSSQLYPVPNRPLLVSRIRENYLRKPVYKQNFFDTSALSAIDLPTETQLLMETFEQEYVAFIRMLKENSNK
jgi:hypothetical protein